MAEEGVDPSELTNSVDEGIGSPNEEENGSPSSNDSETLSKKRRTRTPSPKPDQPLPGFVVPPSPPKFVSFEQLMAAANGVKNMTLAHEIAVDNNFKLEKLAAPPHNSMEKHVTDVMHRAFWNSLTEKMSEDPPDYSHTIILLEELKESLLHLLLPQHVRLKAQITEVLDMELIQQQMDHEAFDIRYYADYVTSILGKLCAPVRDEAIERLRNTKDLVPLFKDMFELVGLMKMDMANFTIQQMRPYIQHQSVEYERSKFKDFLSAQQESGVDGLQFTRLWIKRSFSLQEEKQKQISAEPAISAVPTSTEPVVSMVTPSAILNEAYMELLQWNPANIWPETGLMDQSRFTDLQYKLEKLILISSVLLVTHSTVGTPISGLTGLKQDMKSHIDVILTGASQSDWHEKIMNVAEQIPVDVNKALTKHGFHDLTPAQTTLLRGQITAVVDSQHAVHKLIRTRVTEFIISMLSTQHKQPFQVPPGLSAVEKDLSEVCGSFLRLVSHNRSVFGPWYANIIGVVLKRKQEDLISPTTAAADIVANTES